MVCIPVLAFRACAAYAGDAHAGDAHAGDAHAGDAYAGRMTHHACDLLYQFLCLVYNSGI